MKSSSLLLILVTLASATFAAEVALDGKRKIVFDAPQGWVDTKGADLMPVRFSITGPDGTAHCEVSVIPLTAPPGMEGAKETEEKLRDFLRKDTSSRKGMQVRRLKSPDGMGFYAETKGDFTTGKETKQYWNHLTTGVVQPREDQFVRFHLFAKYRQSDEYEQIMKAMQSLRITGENVPMSGQPTDMVANILLEFVTNDDGVPEQVRVVSSTHPEFNEEALKRVAKFRTTPRTRFQLPMEFRIRQDDAKSDASPAAASSQESGKAEPKSE